MGSTAHREVQLHHLQTTTLHCFSPRSLLSSPTTPVDLGLAWRAGWVAATALGLRFESVCQGHREGREPRSLSGEPLLPVQCCSGHLLIPISWRLRSQFLGEIDIFRPLGGEGVLTPGCAPGQ